MIIMEVVHHVIREIQADMEIATRREAMAAQMVPTTVMAEKRIMTILQEAIQEEADQVQQAVLLQTALLKRKHQLRNPVAEEVALLQNQIQHVNVQPVHHAAKAADSFEL